MATTTPYPASTVSEPRPLPPAAAGVGMWRLNIFDLAYAREMLLPMSIGLILLMLVLAGNFVYWAINSIVNHGMQISPIVRLFLLAAPGFAVQGIPVGVILGVCLILNRAVRDNEVIALRVGGASIPRIVTPFLVMALIASFADWLVVEKVAPRTNNLAEKTLLNLMSRASAPLIDSDKYFRAGNYYFYVQDVSNDHKILHNVMVYARGTGNFGAFEPATFPVVNIAVSAAEDPNVKNQWILRGVVQHTYNDDGSQLSEARYDTVTINVGQEIKSYWDDTKQPFSMTGDELSRKIEDYSKAAFDQNKVQEWKVDYYRRYALPFACFVLALAAAPLSLRFARQGSFAGLVLAFGLAFFWQGFDGWFRALGIAGYLSPMAAAWMTNALFMATGGVLLWRER